MEDTQQYYGEWKERYDEVTSNDAKARAVVDTLMEAEIHTLTDVPAVLCTCNTHVLLCLAR